MDGDGKVLRGMVTQACWAHQGQQIPLGIGLREYARFLLELGLENTLALKKVLGTRAGGISHTFNVISRLKYQRQVDNILTREAH